jgi:hypothetical protein
MHVHIDWLWERAGWRGVLLILAWFTHALPGSLYRMTIISGFFVDRQAGHWLYSPRSRCVFRETIVRINWQR